MPRSDLPHVQHLEKDAQKGATLASIQREAVVRLQVSIHRRQYWRRTCAELQLCTALQQAPRAFSSSMQQQAAAILLPAATADVPKKRVEGAGVVAGGMWLGWRRDVGGLACIPPVRSGHRVAPGTWYHLLRRRQPCRRLPCGASIPWLTAPTAGVGALYD